MKIQYPPTKTCNQIDRYFETDVPDPYRWLEDDRSDETAAWVAAQNQLTHKYLSQIPFQQSLKERLAELWNYEKVGTVIEVGDFIYYYRNEGLQNHSILYRQKKGTHTSTATPFLDPNQFSADGTISLAGVWFSKDGSLCAYMASEGGADWGTLHIIDTETQTPVENPLHHLKFTNISWVNNQGFYYSTYETPDGSILSAKTDQHMVFYHKIGTNQASDKIVYGRKAVEKSRYIFAALSDDDQFLCLAAAQSTATNSFLVGKRNEDTSIVFQKATAFAESSHSFLIASEGNKLLFFSNLHAPNGRIVAATWPNIHHSYWQDIIPESEVAINSRELVSVGKHLFISYQNGPRSQIKQYDFQGQLIRELESPGLGQMTCFRGRSVNTHLYFSFTSYLNPTQIHKMNVQTGTQEPFFVPNSPFDGHDYESAYLEFSSQDGTTIPMIVTHKKGLNLHGSNPTLLNGYGGFNICKTPVFSPAVAVWLEQGGVYAVPNIRGGGEFGKRWHMAGTQQQKQNVFDDFIAAAEFLIEKQYTSSNHLAIVGRSNGGLLVGACMNQRPDLFRVALPGVGVLDMLRYHTFTSGAGWAYDYGTSEDSLEMFSYLKGYSPLHNVRNGQKYPSVMVTTGDHDDRVVPAHSFKFAATLQANVSAETPQLIRIGVNAGHGAGRSTEMLIDEIIDCWSYTLWEMGFTDLNQ